MNFNFLPVFLFDFQTAQTNFYNRQLFEDSPSSSLLRSTYNQRQEQRYLLQAQLENELLQNQIHQRYLEQQQRLLQQHQQQKSAYAKLPHLAQNKSPQKYQQYQQEQDQQHQHHHYMSDGRSIPVQEIQTHLNNTGNRFTKQIHFNLNNVNQYYNNSRHTTDAQSIASLPKSIGYNTCNNNNTINNNHNKTKPYRNNLSCSNKNDNNNHNDTYIEYLQKPIKMQREEIIIEHSQLVLNGNENTNPSNAGNRSNHYTQVRFFFPNARIHFFLPSFNLE